MKIKVKIKLFVSNQDLCDILTTAFEGSIDYWCRGCNDDSSNPISWSKAVDTIIKGEKVQLIDLENEIVSYLLGIKSLRKGLKRFIKENPELIYNGDLDIGNIDANMADTIIQYSIFGEIIFA